MLSESRFCPDPNLKTRNRKKVLSSRRHLLPSATGKNSACEGFGQNCVSDFAKLANNGLIQVIDNLVRKR